MHGESFEMGAQPPDEELTEKRDERNELRAQVEAILEKSESLMKEVESGRQTASDMVDAAIAKTAQFITAEEHAKAFTEIGEKLPKDSEADAMARGMKEVKRELMEKLTDGLALRLAGGQNPKETEYHFKLIIGNKLAELIGDEFEG